MPPLPTLLPVFCPKQLSLFHPRHLERLHCLSYIYCKILDHYNTTSCCRELATLLSGPRMPKCSMLLTLINGLWQVSFGLMYWDGQTNGKFGTRIFISLSFNIYTSLHFPTYELGVQMQWNIKQTKDQKTLNMYYSRAWNPWFKTSALEKLSNC